MSASVVLKQVSKTFPGRDAVAAVDRLELELAEGELLVLLGPSGCGKTTTLRCVAGLEDPQSGSIEIGGTTVFDREQGIAVPPNKRDIGMVFQSYALWPHKSVAANIAYPLKGRGMKDKIREWVPQVAAMVSCEQLLDRLPSQLSGGQQQRVALARGIVARPGVVLFDEPLSNLDARLRDQVRSELHQLHQKLGFSGLYVTHDQHEALALGDRLAVMRSGRIEHLGSPREVFDRPRTQYVAEFIGFVDTLRLDRTGYGWSCAGRGLRGKQPGAHSDIRSLSVCLRPEDLRVAPSVEELPCDVAIEGAVVADRVYAGRSVELVLDLGGTRLRASVDIRLDDRGRFSPGAAVAIGFDAAACMTYRSDGEHADVLWQDVVVAGRTRSGVVG